MSLVESNMLPIGTKAPDFNLPDVVSDSMMSRDDFKSSKATVVVFTCNHCPYVIHINQELIAIANQYQSKGVSFVAISSNDIENYPDDNPDKMKLVAKVLKFPFPYLFDESQEIAKAYDAACTPDFYIFDDAFELVYRGRIDGSRPGNDIPVTGADLRSALDAIMMGVKEITPQFPSAGCNIKWKS